MEFEIKRDCLKLSEQHWQLVVEVAKKNGWVPEGTGEPPGWNLQVHGKWDGGYDTPDNQLVSAKDARAMANALQVEISKLQGKHEYRRSRERSVPFEKAAPFDVIDCRGEIRFLSDAANCIGLGSFRLCWRSEYE